MQILHICTLSFPGCCILPSCVYPVSMENSRYKYEYIDPACSLEAGDCGMQRKRASWALVSASTRKLGRTREIIYIPSSRTSC